MNMDTIMRTKGDLNFNSLNVLNSLNCRGYLTNQSQKLSEDIEKTLSLSIISNNQLNINIDDIVGLNEQLDMTIFDQQLGIQYIVAERNDFTDIYQIENQRLILHDSINSRITIGFIIQNHQMIVIKQLHSDCQENVIKKLDEYKIHAKMNKLFPSSSLQLITPVCIEKIRGYNIEACMEKAEFNLYDYSRKYNISKQAAFAIFVRLIDQIIDMHSINIAHRDVKPQNIFFVKQKGWVLSDFGESQEYQTLDSTYIIRGTKYFLNPSLQLCINKNGQFNQNLLQNDLYALLVTILVIQKEEYITNISEQIENLSDIFLKDVILIKSLKDLVLYRQNLQITGFTHQINLQNPCYKQLNKDEQILNQDLRHISWIGLYYYYLYYNPNTQFQFQLLELIKRNLQPIYENFNYQLGTLLYSMKLNNINIQLIHPLAILKKKKQLPQELKELLIEMLFSFGYTEQTIICSKKILKTLYSQRIHITLIDSYFRAHMLEEAFIEFKNFTQGLVFEQLNTKIQEKYLHHLNFFKMINYDKQLPLQIQFELQELLSKHGNYQFYSDVESIIEQNNKHGQNIVENVLSILQCDSSKFKKTQEIIYYDLVQYVTNELPIELFLQFLQKTINIHSENLDFNGKNALLYETGEILILLDVRSKEISKFRKQFQNNIYKAECYQQIISFKIQYLVFQIFQQSYCRNYFKILDKFLCKINKQMKFVKHITYNHYQSYIMINMLNLNKYLYIFHNNLTNVFINSIILFSIRYAAQNEYHIKNNLNFQLNHIQAQNTLLKIRNYRRCYQLVADYNNLLNNHAKIQIKIHSNQINYLIRPSVKKILSINTHKKSAIINSLESQFIQNNYLQI